MLRKEDHCSWFFIDFLDIIEQDLLVIDKNARISSANLVVKLDALRNRGLANPKYFRSKQQTKRSGNSDPQQSFQPARGNQPSPPDHNGPKATQQADMELLQSVQTPRLLSNLECRLEPIRPISRIDRWRLWCEKIVGEQIDWYPFPQIEHVQADSCSRLVWKVSTRPLNEIPPNKLTNYSMEEKRCLYP
jgi:hypothetical protein